MKLAAAQIQSRPGAIDFNLAEHLRCTQLATQLGAQLILFPEMSITGYVKARATALAFVPMDDRILPLKHLAQKQNIIIIAGAPIRHQQQLYIGSFVLFPEHSIRFYTKRYVHHTEADYFQSSFDHNPTIDLEGQKMGLAICADINHPEHPQALKDLGCTFYLPSIFDTEEAVKKAHRLLPQYAQTHRMHVLMANFYGQAGALKA
ncbi:MAG: carbon-nitrogen hydrolase family protein, partial [Bacteroidota bacterium]